MLGALVRTARLQLAPWTMSDVEAALSIFGDGEAARWLTPAMNPSPDMAAMQHLVSRWGADSATIEQPLGRWKVTDLAIGHTVSAVSLLPLPPDNIDFEIGVQIARGWWGNGYAGEVPRSLVARMAQWRPRTSHSSGSGIRPAPWGRRAARRGTAGVGGIAVLSRCGVSRCLTVREGVVQAGAVGLLRLWWAGWRRRAPPRPRGGPRRRRVRRRSHTTPRRVMNRAGHRAPRTRHCRSRHRRRLPGHPAAASSGWAAPDRRAWWGSPDAVSP
ncbi:GNAT family N-acetyltransferase, partial [Streptomyces sp. NPDC047009]|uniref:GNAT family N-acetyltransferase n=1 Tax=Streptomyces sp. NPDC047009 TaxID=3154496 RepID=UPI0033DFC04D